MANKQRLISLDDALNATREEVYWTESEAASVRSFLVERPKVDAVEVVRCKDCKHYVAPQGTYVCDCFEGLNFATDNDFCSYGERREGE